MSIIVNEETKGRYSGNNLRKPVTTGDKKNALSSPYKWMPKDPMEVVPTYHPTDDESTALQQVMKDFRQAWTTMHYPRVEFNDLSLFQRYITDMAAWNTYQSNDGRPALEDKLGGWRSQAIRPVVRNKTVTLAAHAVARGISPKIFAYDTQNNVHDQSAEAIDCLLTWFKDRSDYSYHSVMRIIAALYSPHSIGYTEFSQATTWEKDTKVNGKWTYKEVEDEDFSGPRHLPIPCDQFFFPNFFEANVQKQDFVILRRIRTYDEVADQYADCPNFKFVHPGTQTIMDDANKGFYQVYDPHMRKDQVEEVIYWRKKGAQMRDVHLVVINGVLISAYDEANPRLDGKYPFDKFFYLPINERCFSGKSLVFSLQSDARILNTLYQMRIDMGMLDITPPIITTGSDKAGSNIFVPGLNIAFADENVQMNPLRVATPQAFSSMDNLIEKVETSLSETSQDPTQQGQESSKESTAYEIAKIEQNASTVLGLFLTMVIKHAIDFGELARGDILQYCTLADLTKVSGSSDLAYKTFFAGKDGQMSKVVFSGDMPDSMSPEDKLNASYKILAQEKQSGVKLYISNPRAVRDLKYIQVIDADVVRPRSKELERVAFNELYDRAIQNPSANLPTFLKQLVKMNPATSKNPDQFVTPTQPTPVGQENAPEKPKQFLPPTATPAPVGA